MRRIFILLYVGVLAVLFAAWYIHGLVLKSRSDAQTARVYIAAHGGGALVIASKLDEPDLARREERLGQLRKRLRYPVKVLPFTELPPRLAREIDRGQSVVVWLNDEGDPRLVAPLHSTNEIVCLGPFPDFTMAEIEASIGGWASLTAEQLAETPPDQRSAMLDDLRGEFGVPIDIISNTEVPQFAQERFLDGTSLVFYPIGEEPNRSWFSATPLDDSADSDGPEELVRFGPFPRFEDIEQRAATTTLALVLLPAALVITLLLRPVAKQLRRVEAAAIEIASGDLGARVDVKKSGSAKQLAVAFNKMASQTEATVRNQRELIQAVSHELRTPLARIQFAIELLEAAKTEQERSGRIQSLVAASEEMDALVGELLEYVKLDGTQSDSLAEFMDPTETIEALRFRFTELNPNIDIQLQMTHSAEAILLLADPHGFQRAISNLLSNACRFAKSTIKISIAREQGMAIIDVDDDGCGIDERDRARAIEPFVQLGGTSNAKGPGVGLGLALVNRIVHQNRGELEIATSPLGGCRVQTAWRAKN